MDLLDQDYGFTALHHAVLSGFEDTVEELIVAGADINAVSRNSLSPLSLAALKARSNIVHQLMARRASLVSSPLLHMACCSGDVQFVEDVLRIDTVRQQLELRSRVPLRAMAKYQKISYSTELVDALLLPLHVAAVFGHIQIVKLCLDMGTNINATFNLTFEHQTVYNIDRQNLDNRVEESNWTALMAAARNGWSDVVRLLIIRGADVLVETVIENAEDGSETALKMAATKGQYHCLNELATWYRLRELPLDQEGKLSALHVAAAGGHVECVYLLLHGGSNVNHRGQRGLTPVMYAAQYGQVSAVIVLAEHDADLNARTVDGDTALMGAAMNGHHKCMETLLQLGVDIKITTLDSGWAAIHHAAAHGSAECVALLIQLGDDINRQTHAGDTPLDCVVNNHELQNELKRECQRSLKSMGATSARPLRFWMS